MVDFFFVLSGFIMYHVYGKLFATSVNGSSFKKFAIARFARVLYLAYKEGFAQRLFANGTTLILSTLCLAICLHFGVPDVITVVFYPLIILSASYGSKNIDKLFGNKTMQKMGDWSFSIYMIHQPIVYTFLPCRHFLIRPSRGFRPDRHQPRVLW